jgi:hypothetical protein
VTTPPSKGLVVELYLIYFGLAQSFVDGGDTLLFDYSNDKHSVWNMNDTNCDNPTVRVDGGNGTEGVQGPISLVMSSPGLAFYACRVGRMCDQGAMLVTINVSECPTGPGGGP